MMSLNLPERLEPSFSLRASPMRDRSATMVVSDLAEKKKIPPGYRCRNASAYFNATCVLPEPPEYTGHVLSHTAITLVQKSTY